MSTGSVSMGETGSPEDEGLVGPLLTGRGARGSEPQPSTARIGPFRVGTGPQAAPAVPSPPEDAFGRQPAEPTPDPAAEGGETWPGDSGFDEGADDLPWLESAARAPTTAPGTVSKAAGEAETVPAFGATDLPDPWDSYLSIGGPRRRPETSDGPETPEVVPPRSSGASSPSDGLPGAGGSPTTPAPQLSTEPAKAEEVARRLEQIARSIRERGPTGALNDLPGDPLAAMVAGYLLGFSGGSPPSGAGPAG